MLTVELDNHLAYEKSDLIEEKSTNYRNSLPLKTVHGQLNHTIVQDFRKFPLKNYIHPYLLRTRFNLLR